jgi:hypothetical protein
MRGAARVDEKIAAEFEFTFVFDVETAREERA